MAEISWAQQAVDRFFEGRKHPCKARCDIMARSVAGASDVRDVDTPGSMSYTVVCTGCAGGKDLVVSFREPEAHLDPDLGRLARTIHGDLVPEASRHGEVEGSRPPLGIYTMPYLQGISCLDALGCQVEMDASTEERHACFSRHLAR
ncbi:hypothetical protein VTK73DRAFT_9189 [Phialemonium thermophilum]|uniref:Uncharacterized protein n=1 Tax=Phialemonium thermophilum TaxID=223376 RepID=A0ABR3W3Z7_9PEZI